MSIIRYPRAPLAAALLISFVSTANAAGWPWPGWQDSNATRVKALALLQTLNATLLSRDSATQTLQRWCAAHHMAPEARIIARRDNATVKSASDEMRTQLQVGPGEALGYRRVALACGDKVLSEADNWYVPSRLSAEMNNTLEHSDTPFGTAVAALHFTRRTLYARLLWSPLPIGWETQLPASRDGVQALDIPERILQHRALLYRQDGKPFSLVEETYRQDIFAFPLDPH
ncbi:hypothetical protein DFP86_101215 [Paludibacterium purpuratum]|uniref:Chorismate lyase n=1 Tax=Paludibacterium purpuratum TaxID=1144873 RepID=A0A4R7BFJ4_9NEIS|nr:hypothetical protein DFP86_101215 [Paludibacterium purpuratum]